nr:SRPBCC family protein [Candidatus Dormibacteraeota bacterium]
MTNITKEINVAAPVRTAYNCWTQFETFPQFMEGVKEVRQLDDKHLQWRAEIGGKEESWDAEIVEQLPDRKIAWRSTTGTPTAGTVLFETIDDGHCRVMLTMEYEPQG